MPAGLGTDATLGTTSVVGRYFGIVSTIPSVTLVAWLYLLLASGSASGAPTVAELAKNNPLERPEYLVAAVVAALLLAFVGHPLQFSMVQLMEGYWGKSQLARNLGEECILRQLNRLAQARRLDDSAEVLQASLPDVDNLSQHVNARALQEQPTIARQAVRSQLMGMTAGIAVSKYPKEPIHVLPTALGNTLRRHEMLAGAAVGLPVLSWATHIGLVADPAHTRYINDRRTEMDLAVRLSFSSVIAAVLTFALLWNDGWWATATLIPYMIAWLCYRGAVASADAYGSALCAWVDLNRNRLYEALGLQPAPTIIDEQNRNKKLQGLLIGVAVDLPLRPPADNSRATQ